MPNLSVTSISAAPTRISGATVRLPRIRQASRVFATRLTQTVRCSSAINTWKTTSVVEINTLLSDQGFKFVDLRDDWEAEKYGRYPSWINIPLANMTENGPKRNPRFLDMIQERFPDPKTPLIIACDDGTLRSEMAAKDLCLKLNYTQVYILAGGTDDYLEQYPIGGGQQQQEAPQEAWQEATAPPVVEPPVAADAPSNTITIMCSTGWQDCFVHFNVDDKGWTDPPGWKMLQEGDAYQLVVEGSRMEFCLNDGGDQWDAPAGNYNITESGTYVVSGGSLSKQ
mmetsp:Transcript_40408/g.114417  ORF Transcript_40408/g.114417 Transcript_40408/m.114417 type:complete len:283 (+) Transcript_40408:209-1057(+)|eukprot:CAMPEP_0117656678 /NCGR_PEP_ID=MMETSP0804-20121206/4931_1 /TAXON_ID=1074897 /ORGANISM="Tetraselmis astigmatica, Strain CCMP880" /LENGTH=282 /DNA_ID=CAMNT_0005463093 /DNA_START=129 /DNA_END=977 /DNA_ORIENTATION=+